MQYRRFGRTELRMPVFSCGGMRYQQSPTDEPLDAIEEENQRNLEATIRRSIELGINHIETARGYGSSERQLGALFAKLWAEGMPRDELIVQSKIPPDPDPAIFRQQVEESLERLNVEYLDLLGLHGINTYELLWHSVRKGGCLEVARQLQAEGKVRHVGFSTHGTPELIAEAIATDVHGGFDYVNLHWYYIYQRNWSAVEQATDRDMGVFIISPSDKGGMLYSPPAKLVELCQPLHPLVFNCLFCLRRPEVHTLSLGASCPSDFDLQLTSLPLVEQVDKVLPPIEERLRDAYVLATGQQDHTCWFEGLPDWELAPDYMNLGVILWLRALALAFDMTDYAKMRYNLLGRAIHWFPGTNAASLDSIDPDRLAKGVQNSPFAEQIPAWLRESHDLLRGEAVERLTQS